MFSVLGWASGHSAQPAASVPGACSPWLLGNGPRPLTGQSASVISIPRLWPLGKQVALPGHRGPGCLARARGTRTVRLRQASRTPYCPPALLWGQKEEPAFRIPAMGGWGCRATSQSGARRVRWQPNGACWCPCHRSWRGIASLALPGGRATGMGHGYISQDRWPTSREAPALPSVASGRAGRC